MGGVHGQLERWYRRLGPARYVAAFYVVTAVGSFALCALAVLAFSRYREAESGDLLALGAVAEGAIALVTVVGSLLARRSVQPAVAWLRGGGTEEEADEAWRLATSFPVRFALPHFGVAILVAVVPVTAFTSAHLDLDRSETLGLGLTMVVAGAYPTVLYTFAFEVWLRPLVRRLGGHRQVRSIVPLRARLYAALPAIAVSTAFVAIVLRLPPDLDRIGVEVLAALAIGIVASVPLVVLVSQVVLGPVAEIVEGTRRVREGDFATRVPALFGDELGMLAGAFNDMTASLQEAREQEVRAREEERRRVAHDLHDGLGPTLAAMALRLQRASRRVAEDPEGVRAELDELSGEARDAVGDVRRLVYNLRPPSLDDAGLLGAIERAAASFAAADGAPRFVVRAEGDLPRLPAAVEVAALRIAHEAMTNAVRHAQAARCDVRLSCNGALELEVADDGRGVRPGTPAGVGTGSMRQRAEELGGTFELRSAASGTTVFVRLPVEER